MKIGQIFLVSLFLTGCQIDDPEPTNEEELITTLKLSFQKLNVEGQPDGAPQVYAWKDEDGAGAGEAIIDPVTLLAHSNYKLSITLLDESKTPVVDITEEVEEEGAEHQFFVSPEGADLLIEYDDVDGNGKPVGLKHTVTVDHGSTGGTLKVILLHQPDKNAPGVASGDPTNAGGDTDIEAVFPLTIGE